jgi:phospholipid/cholesterol/gamma-HCH transport system ATP-binding protein
VPPQITATPGMPERKAVARRQARVRENLHLLPSNAQEVIRDSLEGTHKYAVHEFGDEASGGRHRDDDAPTVSIPAQREY